MSRLVPVVLLLAVGSAGAQGPEPPPAIHLSAAVSPAFKLLSQPAVQAELRLTARQEAAVLILTDIRALSPHVWEAGSLGWITPEIARAEIERQTREFLSKGLTREQRARLDQVVYQLREREFGAHAAFAMAARDLGLRAEQLEDVQHLKGQRVDEIVRHVTSGERYERVRARVAATNGDTFEKMAEMLTRAQRERLTELKGKPFQGKGNPGETVEGEKAKGRRATPAYPPELFGVYDYEIRYLDSLAVRNEVETREDQRESIAKAIQAWDAEYQRQSLSVRTVGNLHDSTSQALGEILTEEQRKRFDRLMAGRRRAIGGYEAACGYPSVVASLRLTPIQLKELKEGKLVGEVLTKAQAKALDGVVGKPIEVGYIPDLVRDLAAAERRRQAQENARVSSAVARSFLSIAQQLKLSAEQIQRLRELAEDEPKIKDLIRRELSFADTPPVAGAARTHSVAGAVMERYQAAVEEQCWKVLDDAQRSMARKIFGRGQ